MIKNLTLVVLVFISFCANAQIKKGSILVGGQISAGKFERDISNFFPIPQPLPFDQNEEAKFLNVGISIGKAIKDNKVIGINFNTATNKQTTFLNQTESITSKNNFNEAGLFYRGYKKLGKDFYFFGQANTSIYFSKAKYIHTNSINNSINKFVGASISIAPGLAYAISKKFHLELSLQNLAAIQYSTSKQEFANPAIGSIKSNSYSLNTSLSGGVLGNIGIGFRLIL